jgi:hypothetical protein
VSRRESRVGARHLDVTQRNKRPRDFDQAGRSELPDSDEIYKSSLLLFFSALRGWPLWNRSTRGSATTCISPPGKGVEANVRLSCERVLEIAPLKSGKEVGIRTSVHDVEVFPQLV